MVDTRTSRRSHKGHGPLLGLHRGLDVANLIVEVRDARAPHSTSIASLIAGDRHGDKPRVVVLAKADLAPAPRVREWQDRIAQEGTPCMALDLSGERRGDAGERLRRVLAILRTRVRSALGQVRAVVVGLPNVGKSSLINRLIGRGAARAGDRPGVTRGPQWVTLDPMTRVLDTPGIIAISQRILKSLGSDGYKLAVLNIVPEGTYEVLDVALDLWGSLDGAARARIAPEVAASSAPLTALGGREALAAVAVRSGFLLKDGKPDVAKAAWRLIRSARDGRLGALMLDDARAGQEEACL